MPCGCSAAPLACLTPCTLPCMSARRVVAKDHILDEIRRTAEENGGAPVGRRRFETETGIGTGDWEGRYWARWGDAIAEAGYQPNQVQGRMDEDAVLDALVGAARKYGRPPARAELKMMRAEDPAFPSHNVFARLGDKRQVARRLMAYCADREDLEDVRAMFAPLAEEIPVEQPATAREPVELGFVYLLRSGRNYKLGRSNALGRRERELAIQLPERAQTVHVIRTDDPIGIERYWHQRFAERRGNGEWFKLTADDVAAFRRRKFM